MTARFSFLAIALGIAGLVGTAVWLGDTSFAQAGGAQGQSNVGLPGTHQHNDLGSGGAARITERFSRVSADRIEYSYMLNDPSLSVLKT